MNFDTIRDFFTNTCTIFFPFNTCKKYRHRSNIAPEVPSTNYTSGSTGSVSMPTRWRTSSNHSCVWKRQIKYLQNDVKRRKLNMSSQASRVAGYGQGSKTATVLTNRSNFIMIVTDEPQSARHPDTFRGLPAIRKGVRPMNISTLSLGSSPEKTSYESCMKSVSEQLFNLTQEF